MTTKDRLKEFLSYKKIGRNKFETKLGLANGYMSSKGITITSEVIEKACAEFPDLNPEWLITGKDPMLKPNQSTEGVQLSGRSANYQGTFNEPVNTIMGSGNTVGSSARERIAEVKEKKLIEAKKEASELKHENEKLRAENDHLKMTIELQKSFIEEKERMIKILLEKK